MTRVKGRAVRESQESPCATVRRDCNAFLQYWRNVKWLGIEWRVDWVFLYDTERHLEAIDVNETAV